MGFVVNHLIKHTEEKAFSCSYCDIPYNVIVAILFHNKSCISKKHFRKHTAEKPYICICCQIPYTDLGQLV